MPGCVLRGAVGVIKHGWYRDTCKGAAAGAPRQHTIGMLWLLACVRVRVNMRESGSRKHGPRYARCRACRAHTAGDPLGQCVRVCVCASCVRACTHNRPIIPRTHQTRARAHTPTCPPVAAVRRACVCSAKRHSGDGGASQSRAARAMMAPHALRQLTLAKCGHGQRGKDRRRDQQCCCAHPTRTPCGCAPGRAAPLPEQFHACVRGLVRVVYALQLCTSRVATAAPHLCAVQHSACVVPGYGCTYAISPSRGPRCPLDGL